MYVWESGGKWGKVMTRCKVIFGPTGFNIQMTSFDKEQQLVMLLTIRHILKWSPLTLKLHNKYYRRKLLLDKRHSKKN